MKTSPSIATIAPALVAALAEIDSAEKDGSSDAFKRNGKPFRYTTLDSVIEASKAILTKNGLAIMQWPGELVNGSLSLETVILHTSGEWVAGDFQIAIGKVDPQGVGSALTYARRYAQKAALNISDEDDDAEGHKRAALLKQDAPTPDLQEPLERTASLVSRAAPKSSQQAKRDGDWEALTQGMAVQRSEEELLAWAADHEPDLARLPQKWKIEVRAVYADELKRVRALDHERAIRMADRGDPNRSFADQDDDTFPGDRPPR
jgi:hypothetical protein